MLSIIYSFFAKQASDYEFWPKELKIPYFCGVFMRGDLLQKPNVKECMVVKLDSKQNLISVNHLYQTYHLQTTISAAWSYQHQELSSNFATFETIDFEGKTFSLRGYIFNYMTSTNCEVSVTDPSSSFNIPPLFSPGPTRPQCSRVLRASSRTVAFTRRVPRLSITHTTNNSSAVVSQSPVVGRASPNFISPPHSASYSERGNGIAEAAINLAMNWQTGWTVSSKSGPQRDVGGAEGCGCRPGKAGKQKLPPPLPKTPSGCPSNWLRAPLVICSSPSNSARLAGSLLGKFPHARHSRHALPPSDFLPLLPVALFHSPPFSLAHRELINKDILPVINLPAPPHPTRKSMERNPPEAFSLREQANCRHGMAARDLRGQLGRPASANCRRGGACVGGTAAAGGNHHLHCASWTEMSMEQCRNERARGTGDPLEVHSLMASSGTIPTCKYLAPILNPCCHLLHSQPKCVFEISLVVTRITGIDMITGIEVH
ncbi:hypothetical protein PR048_008846 [Dryococelus australis]|uniref:Uncharacterized protein n=1 Tax=Dryococelus australis TaxID=614101 RepID=A0ABQ9HY92_9NEOP|nr:hypothetical protein PR048_008846 [Dryococelus australis]